MTEIESESKFNQIRDVWGLLDDQTKKGLAALTLALISLNFLDILALFMFASFSSGVFNLVQGNQSTTRLSTYLAQFLGINFTVEQVLLISSSITVACFLIKSLFGLWLNRKTLDFLAHREIQASKKILKKVMSRDAERFYEASPDELHYATGISVSRMFNGVLYPVTQLINDTLLLILVVVTLIIVSPLSTTLVIFVFLVYFFSIGKKMQSRMLFASRKMVESSIQTQQSVRENYEGYREIVTKPYANLNGDKFAEARGTFAREQAKSIWLQQVPRYSLELLAISTATIIGIFEFVQNDARSALVKLSVFAVTVFRILPSVQRLQTTSLVLRGGLIASEKALKVLRDKDFEVHHKGGLLPKFLKSNQQISKIVVRNASYKFSHLNNFVFSNLNFELRGHKISGLLGPSGVGKSTLADCLVGLRSLTDGEIIFQGELDSHIVPSVSLVPQKPFIANASVLSNITLKNQMSARDVEVASKLFKFFFHDITERDEKMDLSLDSVLTSGINSLSGGQAQRIAIMRALFGEAQFIVFDECLSGLSEIASEKIIRYIQTDHSTRTLLLISHSEATISLCDEVFELRPNNVVKRSSTKG